MAYSSMINKELSSRFKRGAKKEGISHHEKYSRKSSRESREAEELEQKDLEQYLEYIDLENFSLTSLFY